LADHPKLLDSLTPGQSWQNQRQRQQLPDLRGIAAAM